MTNYEIRREKALQSGWRILLFQEDDWVIGNSLKEVEYQHPLVGHYCSSTWHYAFSTEYAYKNFNDGTLYRCWKCREMAPDNIITLHTMVIR